MLDRVIRQADLRELVDALARKRRIVGPVRRSVPEADPPERFFYQEVSRADQLDLAFTHCVFSPKAQLFPAHESLFSFDQNQGSGSGGGIGGGFTAEPIFDDRPLALVGVHPCDINAIRLLDTVFSQGTRDEHYLRRRANTLIVGIDCAKPCTEGVFCKDMQTNVADDGFDVMLYPLSDVTGGDACDGGDVRYGVVYGTAAGKEWIQYSRCGSVASAEDEQALVAFTQSKSSAFTNALSTPLEALPALLDRSYDSLLWEATARRCYSCGSCNLVCPTCYCFNMYDEVDMTLQAGERRREWDGCQIRDFALVAGDHNFRPKSASRLRHRIYRKAKWVKEHSGVTGCVGCARCDRACTAKISSVEIFNQLAEEV